MVALSSRSAASGKDRAAGQVAQHPPAQLTDRCSHLSRRTELPPKPLSRAMPPAFSSSLCSLFWLKGNQAMRRLPLLLWIFARSRLQKLMIILGRLLYVSQMIVGCGPQEIADRNIRQIFGPQVRGLDDDGVVLIFICGNRQIAIGFAEIWLELDCPSQFLLRLRKSLLLQKRAPEALVQRCIIGMR